LWARNAILRYLFGEISALSGLSVWGYISAIWLLTVGENAQYINLGAWIGYFTYGVFDGEHFELKEY